MLASLDLYSLDEGGAKGNLRVRMGNIKGLNLLRTFNL